MVVSFTFISKAFSLPRLPIWPDTLRSQPLTNCTDNWSLAGSSGL